MKRNGACWVFALIFGWKVALFVFSAQPVPANDAFFYDGPVVNYLNNGGYYNPAIAIALPISGTQVFSAYPPLYQGALLAWMSGFGTSALSAMAFHLVLFGIYMLILLAIFRALQVPAWCSALAGGYLLLLTFHDRPDSLGHVLGMLAIYCWIRSRGWSNAGAGGATSRQWLWLMVLCSILTLGTSLQIGGIYFLCLWIGVVAVSFFQKEKFPVLPMAIMSLTPVALVLLVKLQFPHLWAGFLEHARQTPSLTGLRIPYAGDLLKVIRTAPGIMLAAVLLPWVWLRQRQGSGPATRFEVILIPALLAALAVVVACLFILTANTVAIANYLQPLIVACYLAWCASLIKEKTWMRWQVAGFAILLLIGSVRAIGMTTWGLACAADVGYPATVQRIRQELDAQPRGASTVLSSAYLYEAARHKQVNWIHSDWMEKAARDGSASDLQGILALKPNELILTQFDYFRRYQRLLEQLKSEPGIKEIRVTNTAKVRAPDSFMKLQRFVQHIAWAPVVVNLSWQEPRQ